MIWRTRESHKSRIPLTTHPRLFASFSFTYDKVDPKGSNELFVDWREKVTLNFTWLFVGSKALFFFYIVYVAIKYGHIKLGRPDEPPEFSTGAYVRFELSPAFHVPACLSIYSFTFVCVSEICTDLSFLLHSLTLSSFRFSSVCHDLCGRCCSRSVRLRCF